MSSYQMALYRRTESTSSLLLLLLLLLIPLLWLVLVLLLLLLLLEWITTTRAIPQMNFENMILPPPPSFVWQRKNKQASYGNTRTSFV